LQQEDTKIDDNQAQHQQSQEEKDDELHLMSRIQQQTDNQVRNQSYYLRRQVTDRRIADKVIRI